MSVVRNIQIEARWSNALYVEYISDFINLHNLVFANDFSFARFNRKYIDNIYGKSLLIYAYDDNNCVGIRAFFRNDLNDMIAYQPCDTAIHPNYRGQGLFSRMNILALSLIDKIAIIYNFPNDNSLSGYIKQGWRIHSHERYKFVGCFFTLHDMSQVEEKYLRWLIVNGDSKQHLKVARIGANYYLVKKAKPNVPFIYLVLGGITRELIDQLSISTIVVPFFLVLSSDGYLGRGLVTVVRNVEQSCQVPVYKMDTLF